jgi:hypothetical protein
MEMVMSIFVALLVGAADVGIIAGVAWFFSRPTHSRAPKAIRGRGFPIILSDDSWPMNN